MDRCYLHNIRCLTLVNPAGINCDGRGVRSVELELHWWPEFTVIGTPFVSLHQLTVAFLKVKSHKFDSWYELFADVDRVELDREDPAAAKWVLSFDHGS